MSEMSQNITLSPTDQIDMKKIKILILEGKNQVEIAHAIGKRRETINRKISRWMQTEDFDSWLGPLWLEQYGEVRKVDKREALRQLTKLYVSKQTRKFESRTEHTEKILHVVVSAKLMKDEPTTTATHT
jgi:phage regulator Rha-like protein